MHLADPIVSSWHAALDLGFERHGATTRLVRREHRGPLRVQKALYPEGPQLCHAIVLHPPAGTAGGDRLQLGIELGDGAQALLTTPGAGKWYRSAGPLAEQVVHIKVGAGATAEWLPQETIVFDGAEARIRTAIDLDPGACFLGVETLCFGRRAAGERFDHGSLHLASEIRREGMLLWRERGVIEGGSTLLDSPIGLTGFSLCSTVLAAGAGVDADTLAACRAEKSKEADARSGVSAMPGIFVGRYLGHSAEAAREWFVALWQHLRPIMAGREAVVPRIWNT
jgi:urease accessory protein